MIGEKVFISTFEEWYDFSFFKSWIDVACS